MKGVLLSEVRYGMMYLAPHIDDDSFGVIAEDERDLLFVFCVWCSLKIRAKSVPTSSHQ